MRLLITGVCGFAGSTLARGLREHFPEWEILGLDNLSREGASANVEPLREAGITLRHGDLRCPEDLETLPPSDVVLDAAANPSVLAGLDGRTSSRQLMAHNLSGTLHLLEYCGKTGAMFILLSTNRVYSIRSLSRIRVSQLNAELANGRQLERFELAGLLPEGLTLEGIREDFSTEPPLSLYGCSKRTSELLALEYGHQFGFPVWINRCGVMAGAGQFGHPGQGIVAYWIHAFREGRPLTFIGFEGTGRQVRDVFHPRDLIPLLDAQIHERRTDHGRPRVLNIGGGRENSFSLAELTHWCRGRFPHSPTGQPSAFPQARPNDVPWLVMDSQLARRVWDWRPQISKEQIFEEIAAFAEAHPHWLPIVNP